METEKAPEERILRCFSMLKGSYLVMISMGTLRIFATLISVSICLPDAAAK